MSPPPLHPTPAELAPFRTLLPDAAAIRVEEAAPAEVIEGLPALREALGARTVTSGWVCFTDRVDVFAGPDALPAADDIVLDAELTLSPSESVHVRHLGENRWQVRRLRTVEDASAFGSVRTVFLDGAPTRRLRYEIGWDLVTDALGLEVLRPRRARFAGFVSEGEA